MPLLLAVLLALCGPARADDAARGYRLFNQSGCRACHSVGNVGGNAGPDLTLVGFRRSREWLDTWLRDPRAWKHDTLMPDFKLSAADRQALVEYLSSLKGQDFGPDRPWLDSSEPGKVLFARAGCVACHGTEGRGGHPNVNVVGGAIPALRGLAQTYTREELIAKIKRGSRPDKLDAAGPEPVAMPAWGQVLLDDEVAQVADYLLSLGPAPGAAKADW